MVILTNKIKKKLFPTAETRKEGLTAVYGVAYHLYLMFQLREGSKI